MIEISDYRSFLIQKGEEIKESNKEWDIVVKSIPFRLLADPKEYASTNWPDQNGDDEFTPENPVYKAYEMEITFYCITAYETANDKIKSFWEFIRAGQYRIYDTYTKIGRQNIRYVSYNPQAFRRRLQEGDTVEFTIKFKVNDPVTDITITAPV